MEEVRMVNSVNRVCNHLEPLLRRVVNEEVERVLQGARMATITRSPSLRIEAQEPPTLKLVFTRSPLDTIFTCNKILDIYGDPLQLTLVEKQGHQMTPKVLPYPIRVEIVAVDGDFPSNGRDASSSSWTVDEFNGRVIKERVGKRPLLTKDVHYNMRNCSWVTIGELEFTDNSSWIRSRRFRLGARVVALENNNNNNNNNNNGHEHGVRIVEALTDPFVVKDHRGEAYKKHYPPMLEDEVWRLDKIGKDGKFHKRLAQAGIQTVQDFLKLSVIDSFKLKKILGGKAGIPGKMWEIILKHARTCNVGNKLYISTGSNYSIILDAICQVVSTKINGQIYSTLDFNPSLKSEVENLVKIAYENWDSLQEVDRPINEIFHPSQENVVEEWSNNEPSIMPYEIVAGGIIEVDGAQTTHNNLERQYGNWQGPSHLF